MIAEADHLANAAHSAAGSESWTDRFPISFAQRAIQQRAREASTSRTLHRWAVCRIAGDVKPATLQAALDDLVKRHEILRTGFEEEAAPGGSSEQVVHGHAAWPLRCRDLAALDAETGEREAEALRRELLEAPFDLRTPPLARACLAARGPGDAGVPRYDLLLVLHPLVADEDTMVLLRNELSVCHAARLTGRVAVLPPLAIQYADYASWQRQYLTGPTLRALLGHWRQKLDGASSALSLARDGAPARAPDELARKSRVTLTLDEPLNAGLRALGRTRECSLFAVLMAGWCALLSRCSGQETVCVGYTVAARERPETHGLPGPVRNTLVLRVECPAGQTAGALIRQVHEAVLEARAHQDLPVDMLATELKPSRGPGALFQTVLTLDEADTCGDGPVSSESGWAELAASDPAVAEDAMLAAMLRTLERTIQVTLVADADTFAPATVSRFGQLFERVLRGMVADVESPVASLPLSAGLAAWRSGQREPAQPAVAQACVHELFRALARRQPAVIAVACGNTQLTYGELLERVDRMASLLRAAGIGAEHLVAVGLGRDAAYVVAILAVLCAGGAYVMLDVSGPLQRQLDVIDDTRATVVITDEAGAATYAGRVGIRVLVVSRRGGETLATTAVAKASADLRAASVSLDQLAYCLYTSGSTGRPKGVLNTHAGLANLARWFFSDKVATKAAERVLMASGVTFDLSQKSVLATLAYGGTVVIPDGDVADAHAVHAAIARHAPTRISCAPSAYRAYGLPTAGTSLRTVVLGGEPITPDLARQIRNCGMHLVNSYGPTECADISASHLALVGDDAAWTVQPLPIGHAIPGARLYVMDTALEPLPPGVVGEIHIAGVGVGRGYLRRASQTAEHFLPDPFGAPGSRMYATGDLGRLRGDGAIEFLGRRDSQVKVRGIRIETGEIEAAIRASKDVEDAAVVPFLDGDGATALLACVVPREGVALAMSALRASLAATLPSHLVPAAWTQLDALPLNRSGKLDRRALARLGPSTDVHGCDDMEPPATPTEQVLHRLWCELLGTRAISRHDNFFAMGGHSLLAMTMAGRLRSEHGMSAAMSDCLNAESLADLGARLDAASDGRDHGDE